MGYNASKPAGATYNDVLNEITTNVQQPQSPSPVLSGVASSLVVPLPMYTGNGIAFLAPTPTTQPPTPVPASPPIPSPNTGTVTPPAIVVGTSPAVGGFITHQVPRRRRVRTAISPSSVQNA